MRSVSACTLDGYFQTYKNDVFVAECDLLLRPADYMEGIHVVIIEIVVPEIDIFVSPTGNFNISMKKLNNNAFVGDTAHLNNEIDFAGSEGLEGVKVDSIKPLSLFASSPLAPAAG